jgi:hypothetical protein
MTKSQGDHTLLDQHAGGIGHARHPPLSGPQDLGAMPLQLPLPAVVGRGMDAHGPTGRSDVANSAAIAKVRRRKRYSKSSCVTATPPGSLTWSSGRRMHRRSASVGDVPRCRYISGIGQASGAGQAPGMRGCHNVPSIVAASTSRHSSSLTASCPVAPAASRSPGDPGRRDDQRGTSSDDGVRHPHARWRDDKADLAALIQVARLAPDRVDHRHPPWIGREIRRCKHRAGRRSRAWGGRRDRISQQEGIIG